MFALKQPDRCERQQKTSCVMEAGSLTIFLCALFIFSAEGAPKFTKEPQNPLLVVEGDNITLEWGYTFGEGESLLLLSIVKGRLIVVNKYPSGLFIPTSYQGRLHANITNSYASVTLLGVNRLEMGSYTLKVSSQPSGESNSSTVKISVQYLDKPDIHSTDMRPAEGTAVKISCIVDGQPPPIVSWTMNGSPLNTSGNSRIFLRNDDKQLNIMNLKRTDSGEYRCVAQNIRGNISSNASVLSVRYQPEIALNTLNATKVEGENITWSCNATGNPEPIISWIFYGSNINTTYNPRIVFSKGRQEMTITSIIRTDNGEYQCMASNMVGNVSSRVATLDVLYKPEISPLPRMIQRTEGEKMILFCNATGNPVPTISWIINGFSLDTNNSSRMNLSYEGKQLTIKNVRRTDSALYRCVAENSLGNVTSHNTTLEVHYIPGVTVVGGPQQFAIVGKVKKLLCKYDAVPPVSEVQWIKEGDIIARNTSLLVNESRLTVSLYNESQIQLLINQSTSHDAGNYTCLVINAVGNSPQKTSVISQELPLITIHPERKTPMQGEKITLSCNATGNPEPSISWVKDGSPINSNSRINFSQGNKRLTITNISRTDSGKYRCVARNRVGNDTLNSRVDVLFEPEVTIDGDHEQYVAKGSDIRLICRYDAFPPVSEVQWIKNGTAISGNTSRLISDSRVTISSFSKSQIQLTITAASLKDGGNYTCRVTNILNSTQDTTLITIVDILVKLVPDPPQNITVDTKGSRIINISWTAGFDGNCAIKNYTVDISQHNQILKDVVCQGSLSSSTCVVSRLSTTASLTGLFPWTTYNIRVFASNKIGRSNSSPILNVTTDEEVPSEAPIFIVTVLNSTAVNVSWQMLSKDIARGAVLGYYVLHRLNSTPPWINKTVDRAELTSLLVGPLNEHTSYEFAMQAFNSKGASHLSASVRKTTDQHKPSSTPQAVTVSATSSKSIFVSWDPVTADDRNGIIKGYIVNYQALPNGYIVAKILNITNEEQNNRQTVTLSNLNEFTNYSIGVLAFTVFGNGPVSVSQVVETLEDKPSGAPQAVTVGVTSSRSISVSWHPVIAEDRNGIIKGYRVNYHALPNTYAVTKFLNITKEQQNKRQTVTLDNLNEFTNYSIGVLAFTLLGNGPASVGQVVETLEDKPTGAPQAVTVSVTSSRSISVSWDPVIADDRNGIVKGYKVNYQALPNGDIATKIFKITKEQQNKRQTMTLGNLNEFTNYSIGVLAFTVFGNGPASVGQVVETLEDKPNNAPHAVTVSATSSRSISVSWDPVVADDRNGIIRGYIVSYQALPNGHLVAKILNITNEEQNNRQTVTLVGLNEFTNYSIGVLAFTIFGNGPASVGQVVETLEDKPSGAPQAVTVNVTSSRGISVSWDPVVADDRNGIIKGYIVNYQALPNGYIVAKILNITNDEQNNRQTVTLVGLNEFANYSIGVLAFTISGNGPASVGQVVETLEDIPSNAPQAVTVSATSSKSIFVSWDPVIADDRNGIIKGYKVNYQALPNGDMAAKFLNITRAQQNKRQTVTLDHLNEFTNYSIGVLAFTAFGNGPASVGQVVETLEDKPSRGAENVSFSEVNYTTNKITWAELPKEAANGVIKLYEVRLELKESCLKVDFTFHAMNTTKSSVLLTGFWMCAKYEVSVRGYTVAGPGPYSKAIVAQTKSLKLSQTWSKERPSPPSFSQIPSGEGITANITLPRFPGNAKFFQVIVIRYSLDYTGVVNSPENFTPKDLMTYEEAHKSPVPAAYVTFQFRGQDFDVFREFVVGDGGHSSSKPRNRRSSDGKVFLNKSLQPNTNYRVFLRAFIEKMVYFSSNFVTIQTKGEPTVKDLPERTIFQVGDVVVLTCEATGDPKPSVTWSKDGNSSIPRAQFRNDDHILVIQEVAPSDGGIYECRASNIFGQRRTATAVIIAVPPSIMKDVSPRSVLCAKQTSCSLLCHATSDILFNYSWTRNGQALDGHNIKVMNNSVIITPLDDQDFGDYVCHATNSFGSTTYKITLSESKEEENNVQSIFRTNDIVWSWIVFLLLVLIGVLIWRLRRAQASNRLATAKKATIKDSVQSVFPLEQHASEPGSYMELRPRPSEGQTGLPPEYQSLQGSHVNAGYYNVVPKEGNKRGSNEEIYEEIDLSNC